MFAVTAFLSRSTTASTGGIMNVILLPLALSLSLPLVDSPDTQTPSAPPQVSGAPSSSLEIGSLAHAERAHSSWIGSLAFSADGKLLVSGSADSSNSIKLWSLEDGVLLARLDGLKQRLFVMSPEGAREIDSLGHSGVVTSVALTPDRKSIVSTSADNTIKIWSVADRRVVSTLHGATTLQTREGPLTLKDPLVWAARLSPDGRVLVYSDRGRDIRLLDVPDLAEIGRIETLLPIAYGSQSGLALSANGKAVAAFDYHAAEVWDVTSRRSVRRVKPPRGGIKAVALSPDGAILATGTSDGIHIWDVSTGAMSRELSPPRIRFQVYSLEFTPDGRRLIAATNPADMPGVEVWSVADGSRLARLRGPEHSWVRTTAVSPDGKTLATGSELGHVCLWALDPLAFRMCLSDPGQSK